MNNNIRILIVEDTFTDALRLETDLCEMGYHICGIADNSKDALGIYITERPDLVILDIMLHEKKEGISIAEKMNALAGPVTPVLFLTAHIDRQIFEEVKPLLPFGYLLKPFNKLELQYAIELAIEKSNKQSTNLPPENGQDSRFLQQNLFIKKGNHLVKIPVNSIYYIEVEGKYCNVIGESGKYLIELSLKEMLTRLRENDFLQIHRNYVINLNEVREIDLNDEVVVLKTGARIFMSRRFKTEFLEKFRPIK